ncbi:Calcium-binding EF-hand-containing protein [Candidatus Sulfopaludibacter sp. SbA4]|nr:Calcium-binding EF-hand-containing protein [Candidatus Sulfopaludibacter sp. SbA4]
MRLIGILILGAVAMLSAPPDTKPAAPTYNKDIAPILYKNCAGCHRPGEVAPFSLLTYQDTAKRAALIAAVTKARVMPPWKAEPGYGHFQDERRLTEEQIALIGNWATSGTPEGDAFARPSPPTFTDGWQLGKPDRVVTIPAKFNVPADGPDQFRCFVIPLNLEADVNIGAAEFRADNRRVVHHALLFTDPAGQARKLAAGSPDGGYTCFGGPGIAAGLLGGWAPGQVAVKPVPGYAATLRKGTDLVLQVHYHPSGKAEQDQSSYGFFFTDPPTRGRALAIVGNNRIDIAPGDAKYVVKASATIPADTELLRITPHAHYLCKDMKVNARLPDGSVVPLIWIKDWDFNWQGSCTYATPVKLPKGTRVEMEYTYDNSEGNPRNPAKPPVRVTYGEQTTNEMALVFMSFSVPTPQDAVTFTREMFRTQVDSAAQNR